MNNHPLPTPSQEAQQESRQFVNGRMRCLGVETRVPSTKELCCIFLLSEQMRNGETKCTASTSLLYQAGDFTATNRWRVQYRDKEHLGLNLVIPEYSEMGALNQVFEKGKGKQCVIRESERSLHVRAALAI